MLHAHPTLKADIKVAIVALTETHRALNLIDMTLFKQAEFVSFVIKNISNKHPHFREYLEYIDESLLTEEFFLEAIQYYLAIVTIVPDTLKKDEAFFRKLIQVKGEIIEFVDSAVSKNLISDALNNITVMTEGLALKIADSLGLPRKVAPAIADMDPKELPTMYDKLKDRLRTAAFPSGKFLNIVQVKALYDRNFLLKFFETRGTGFRIIDEDFQKDEELLQCARKGLVIEIQNHIDIQKKQGKGLSKNHVELLVRAITDLYPDGKEAKNLLKMVVDAADPNIFVGYGYDYQFVKKMLAINGWLIEFLKENKWIKREKGLLFEAVLQNPEVLEILDERIRRMRKIAALQDGKRREKILAARTATDRNGQATFLY